MMDFIRQFQVAGRRFSRDSARGSSSEPRPTRSRRFPLTVEPLERRELLATIQDFQVPGVGTPFTPQQFGSPPGPTVVPQTPTTSAMELTSGLAAVPNQNNQISFNTSDSGTFNSVSAAFQFRIFPGTGRGDGLSFALLNTTNFGTTGAATQSPVPEKGLFTNSLGIGFDTTQGPSDPSDNFVVVSFNSTPIQSVPINKGVLDLASGLFIQVQVSVNFVSSLVSVTLTPSGGSALPVISGLPVAGLSPYQSRVNFAARSVTTLATMDLSNVAVQFVGSRAPGSISFASTTYTVAENTPTGFAAIDLVRTGGTAGSVTINFVTADGTAKHGVNYTSITQLVTFGEGQSTQTVDVPVIADGIRDGDKTVKLFLSNPTLQAGLIDPLTATLTITETDPVPPRVSPRVQLIYAPHTHRVTGFRLTFSQSMDKTSAQNLANYVVILPPVHKNGPQRFVALSSAVLDPTGLLVTLNRANVGMHLTRVVQILVRGKPTTGLKDTTGTFLAGVNSQAGTDALLTVSV